MPRKPDPALEKKIVIAAAKLLEEKGLDAVTMREVAKAAGTTTPTIYEKFGDREALMRAVTDVFRDQLIATLDPHDSLEEVTRKFLDFTRTRLSLIDLLIKRIAENLSENAKGPVFEMIRVNLMKNGFSPQEAKDITVATSSFIAGSAILANLMGPETRASRELEKATLRIMRRLETPDQKK